jgi:phosphopantothenoylcysteine decarboxylase / phosphopantothenate---cysteine ligase
MLTGKRILLIIGGGIAAYKNLELIRRLSERDVAVKIILTRAGAQFVTPLSLASLSRSKVHDDLFSLTDEAEMGHIELSRSADLLVVAPATADLMAKMANGQANDLATTALLATDKPVLIVPAMNVRMWNHPATQRNLAMLKGDGVLVCGPEEGPMACGEYGPGRMSEVADIVAAIEGFFSQQSQDKTLAGRRVLVTAGPTHEPIDPVRYIGNRSSGKQGYAVAAAAAALGAETVLISGPVALAPPDGVKLVKVETALDMKAAVEAALPVDIAVFAAAVADWRVEGSRPEKIKKQASGEAPQLSLVENPDILREVAGMKAAGRPRIVVGFAAETENVLANAKAKLARKGCDMIIANDVSPAGGVMGSEENRVQVVTAQGVESWPDMSKRAVAARLMALLAAKLEDRP